MSMSLSTLIANRQKSVELVNTVEKNEANDISFLESETKAMSQSLQGYDKNSEKSFVSKWYDFLKLYGNSVVFRIFVGILAIVTFPLPGWFSGFLAGAVLSGYITYVLFKPGRPKERFIVPDFSKLPPSVPVTEVEDEPIIYKGWMNELPSEHSYNPETYHVNSTRSLYVRLDGSYLRVSYPQNNIPKRAMFNEARHDMQFIHQQHFDITGASAELLPVGLARKRLWSKKYPICLRIPSARPSVLPPSDAGPKPPPPPGGRRESAAKSGRSRFVPRLGESGEAVLYLFARTDRDKDLWFGRFRRAARLKLPSLAHSPSSSPNIAALDSGGGGGLENRRALSVDLASLQLSSPDPSEPDEDEVDAFTDLTMSRQQKFELYMSHLMAPLQADQVHSFAAKDKKSANPTSNLAWLNVMIGRLFFDFLSEEMWAQLVSEKIQKKLSKIKLPVFLKELTVRDISLGSALPKVHRASDPSVDQRGLWIDVDVSYNGSFQMTLETKINLLRARCDAEGLSMADVQGPPREDGVDHILRSPVYNSEEEDSAESSSDEDLPLPEISDQTVTDDGSAPAAAASGGSAGKKLLRLVDRLAQSAYLQSAARNKYIKRAMEDISNTPLVLTVEVQWLTGTLALNIPPAPADRLWYGFRKNPQLSIVARPKLGQHVVTLTHVTDWIERKLVSEFQKILVMPNMDDLIIPIMQPDPELS